MHVSRYDAKSSGWKTKILISHAVTEGDIVFPTNFREVIVRPVKFFVKWSEWNLSFVWLSKQAYWQLQLKKSYLIQIYTIKASSTLTVIWHILINIHFNVLKFNFFHLPFFHIKNLLFALWRCNKNIQLNTRFKYPF